MSAQIITYILNILIIALPIAIFEILIERTHGWGSGWDKNKWYARPFAPKSEMVSAAARGIHIERPLNYHVLMFLVIIPVALLYELFFLIGGFSLSGLLLIIACYIAILVFEDFFWFLLNWYYKGSLRELLKGPQGAIWWHKSWLRLSKKSYLPSSYFEFIFLSFIFLILA